jgi:hypothetical protein
MKSIFGLQAILVALLCCMLSGCASGGRGSLPPRYHYVPLDGALPQGYTFFGSPMRVNERRQVFLNAFACGEEFCAVSIVKVQHGAGTILYRDAQLNDMNEHGLIGGSVVPEPQRFVQHAALFRDGHVHRLPPMPRETSSWVSRVSDSGKALVGWIDDADTQHYYLYSNGSATPISLGDATIGMLDLNARGIVSGTMGRPFGDDRAFRLDPFSRRLTVLEPVAGNRDSWGQGINRRGDVPGYSWGRGPERIGVWRGTAFETWFVEGTPDYPTISNRLLWNERGEIVITETLRSGGDPNSYLVPRPGVRLRLADISDRLPFFWTLIEDINERGDIVGQGGPDYFDTEGTFLLERIDGGHSGGRR